MDKYHETIGDLKKRIIETWLLDDVTIERLTLYIFNGNLKRMESLTHKPDNTLLCVLCTETSPSIRFDVIPKSNVSDKSNAAPKSPHSDSNHFTKVQLVSQKSSPVNSGNDPTHSSNVIFSNHEIPLGLCGLDNTGNTCFMNSALQCLSNISPLTAFFIHEQTLKFVNSENPAGTGGRVALTYSTSIKEMWSGQMEKCTPIALKRSIDKYTTQFTEHEQHDCQEFMGFLLDALHEDLLDPETKTSPISRLFQGQLESTVRCQNRCPAVQTVTPFNFLSLPITSDKTQTNLLECMEGFLKSETIGKHGKWYCNSCRQQTDAVKHIKIKSLPPVLILQLKRFNTFPGHRTNNNKIQTIVNYPINNLNPHDLSPALSSTAPYDLVAISIHRGTLHSGHYITLAKNHKNKLWYEFDDSLVTSANNDDIKNPNAYILCYVRKDVNRIPGKT